MSRMRLFFDKPRQPTGNETVTYPIYELDLQGLSDARMVSWGLSGQVTNAVNECYYLSGGVNNANVNQYLSTNIPHQQWQDGSILQARISKYFLNENNVYVPDPEYYDFEEIPIGQQPDDWGVASNYMKYQVLSNATIGGRTVTYRAYYNVLQTSTWDASAQYVRDKNRKMIRLFYTENGYSFGVYQGADCVGGSDTGPVFNVAGYSQYSYDYSNPSPSRYIWRNPGEARLYVGGNSIPYQSSCYSRGLSPSIVGDVLAGNNAVARSYYIFVHAVYNDKDYYGTMFIFPNDSTETATFNQINFALYTDEFWGDSILPGGGGESNWGPIPDPGYPEGSFSTNTTNVGDRDGQHILTETEHRRVQTFGIFSAGIYSIYEVAVYGDYSKLAKIENELFNNEFMTRYAQTYYDPLSGVLAMHILPTDFCVYGDWGNTEYDVIVAGYNVSDKWYQHAGSAGTKPVCKKLQHIHSYHVGSIDLGKMYDGFPDFSPFTKAILHLPFVGECELNMNSIAHGILGITYTCDVMNGNIIVSIWAQDYNGNKQVVKVVNGNCAYSLPLYTKTMDGSAMGKMLSGVVSTLMSGAVGAATMNPLSLLGVASGIANTVSAAAEASRTSTMVKGDLGGSAMLLSPYDCWLEVIHPKWVTNMYYSKLMGSPSQMSNRIADNGQQVDNGTPVDSGEPYTGYLQVQAIELDSVNCTESERSEIEKLLQSGVYVRGDELL